MSSFNIESLLQFTPPRYMCQKCCALNLPPQPTFAHKDPIVCPVCQVKYLSTDDYHNWQILEYLQKEASTSIEFNNPIAHAQRLASTARSFRAKRYPPVRALFAFLLMAEQFVHFTTYGISHQFIGALKLAAQRVTIRGAVTNAASNAIRELKEFPSEAPGLQIQAFGSGDRVSDVPHQKLIVVDGLVAFKGSTNLTVTGWRKAEKGLDLLEVITDVDQVIKIHIEYFSPLWGQHSDCGDAIEMEALPF